MSSTDNRAEEVSVLVRYGSRCRRIVLSSGSSESELRVNIRDVFGDLLGAEQRFFLQLKDDDWGGEFIDVPDGLKVADRSVFRLLLQEVCHTFPMLFCSTT